MSDAQVRKYFQAIQQQIATLQQNQTSMPLQEIMTALDELQLTYDEMQTSLEAAELIEEELFRQNQRINARYHYYYDLFQSSPIAYIVTNASGVILETNQAIAQMLNVPQRYLVGKPLAVFVAESARLIFYNKLNRLTQNSKIQHWQINLCPLQQEPFDAQLHISATCNISGTVEALQIAVYNMNLYQHNQSAPKLNSQEIFTADVKPLSQLPHLDGLQVLVVDDETDAREFITAVLESHGIRVTAVASTAAAIEALERFHPDVLLSDIRMPDEDGYSLIRKVRELEASRGWHIPAAAFTAYLTEDREKALSAGFEAHLHKLAQPTELIAMVTQLTQQNHNAY